MDSVIPAGGAVGFTRVYYCIYMNKTRGGFIQRIAAHAGIAEERAIQYRYARPWFLMYCSFGNANRLAASPAYKEILFKQRQIIVYPFQSHSWLHQIMNAKNPDDFIVIIDNMMNLELLFWATRASGDSSFYKIAVTHANTTMKNHFRPDFSSYHVLNYNAATGAVQQKKTAQGFADESAWARGQAWGLYGYTVMYRETKDKKYLDQATHMPILY